MLPGRQNRNAIPQHQKAACPDPLNRICCFCMDWHCLSQSVTPIKIPGRCATGNFGRSVRIPCRTIPSCGETQPFAAHPRYWKRQPAAVEHSELNSNHTALILSLALCRTSLIIGGGSLPLVDHQGFEPWTFRL